MSYTISTKDTELEISGWVFWYTLIRMAWVVWRKGGTLTVTRTRKEIK